MMDRVQQLTSKRAVITVHTDMCEFGLTTTDAMGEAPAKKPTRFLTNSPMVAEQLDVRCKGNHRHAHLIVGRVVAAAQYTDRLCEAIVRGVIRQKKLDGGAMAKLGSLNVLSQAQHDELQQHSLALHEKDGHNKYKDVDADNALMSWYRDNPGDMVASDDVSGTRLRPEAVIEARRTELDFFCRMKVYTKVSRREALARGKQVIQVR